MDLAQPCQPRTTTPDGGPSACRAAGLQSRHPTWHVSKIGESVLLVRGDFRTPFLVAAEVLEAVDGLNPVGVWTRAESADWAIAVREGNELIRVDSMHGRLTWRHFRLSNLIGPLRIAREQGLANRVRIPHVLLSEDFVEARQILAATGIDISDPPLA